MMKGYDQEAARSFILSKLDQKEHRSIWKDVPDMIADMITYDLHFMKLTGVIDENGEQGDSDYDDDEAFEYIYDAWLSDHPEYDDEDLRVAALLNDYMDCQYQYLLKSGLA